MDRMTTKIGDKIYYAKGDYSPTTLVVEMKTQEIRECMEKLAMYEDMDISKYKVAVNMLMETLEFHIEGYQMGLYDEEPDEWLKTVTKSVKQRLKVVRKFDFGIED